MAACLSPTLSPQIKPCSPPARPAAEPQARQHNIADYMSPRHVIMPKLCLTCNAPDPRLVTTQLGSSMRAVLKWALGLTATGERRLSVCLCAGRRNEDARSCRGGSSVMGTVRDLPCPHGQSAAANSASRRRRLTGKPATESNLSLSAPAQRAVRGGIGSFRACQRWAAVGLCCGQSLLSLRDDRRLVQPGLPRRTVPPQSGRSPGRRAGTRRTGSSACRERPDRLSKRPPVVGDLACRDSSEERCSRSRLVAGPPDVIASECVRATPACRAAVRGPMMPVWLAPTAAGVPAADMSNPYIEGTRRWHVDRSRFRACSTARRSLRLQWWGTCLSPGASVLWTRRPG